MSLAVLDGAEHRIPFPPLVYVSSGNFSYLDGVARYGTGIVYTVGDGGLLRWGLPTPDPEVWFGFAQFQNVALGGTAAAITLFGDGSTVTHLTVYIAADGSLSVYRGTSAGTLLGTTATGLIGISTWNYIEFYGLIDDTVGAFELRVNGVNVLDDSGIDTRNGGTNANVTVVGTARLQSGTNWYVDDVYCTTGDGSGISGFQDEISIQGIKPNGNGNYSQLVGQDGDSTNNYLNVDEVPFSTTDYNGSSTPGNKDTYAYENLTATTGDVIGTVLHSGWFKFNPGFIKARRVIRISGTDYNGADTPSLSATLVAYSELIPVSPATSAAWTISEVNAIENGGEVRSA